MLRLNKIFNIIIIAEISNKEFNIMFLNDKLKHLIIRELIKLLISAKLKFHFLFNL